MDLASRQNCCGKTQTCHQMVVTMNPSRERILLGLAYCVSGFSKFLQILQLVGSIPHYKLAEAKCVACKFGNPCSGSRVQTSLKIKFHVHIS